MCGRTACTLAPDDVCKACQFKNKQGKSIQPMWRDAPGSMQYYPSYNIAPGAHTPVLISSKHYEAELEEITPRIVQPMRWGLIPSWHKGAMAEKTYETNNCRAESMLQKQTYRVPLQKGQRCVVLADGFFEWKRSKDSKQPYFIYFPQDPPPGSSDFKMGLSSSHSQDKADFKTAKDDCNLQIKSEMKTGITEEIKIKTGITEEIKIKTGIKEEIKKNTGITEEIKTECGQSADSIDSKLKEIAVKKEIQDPKMDGSDQKFLPRLLTVAGVFDVWNPPDGSEQVYSYSVITVDASPAMSWIHDRMPAILTTDEEIEEWLDYGNIAISKAVKLIRPVECIQLHPVSTVVNNSRNKTPECVMPIDLSKPKKSASSSMMMNWLSKGKPKASQSHDPSHDKLHDEGEPVAKKMKCS
ncbi:hypothetical protein CHS0354_017756 [Potamilus streckersoni]|uniref:Abasic site processing protein HMCES n=1 Tax=Potamilus streckersoni TaxID=2493646 RepID=A0AAE0W9X4_9BIVA|nr:hypothetical protein CHS0354_017756 [Potamilus streckersoni]